MMAGARRTGSPSSAPNSPAATTPRQSRSSRTTSIASATSTLFGWTLAPRRSPRSRRSKTRAKPYPIITGEDQEDFLKKWKDKGLTAIGPTYPTYQWRTAIIAAVKILKGEPVSGPNWKLRQPTITQADLDKYVNDKLPPLHYAMCGCEDLPGYPQRWGGK